ncbi:MAG TPA: nitrogenase component 1 [Mobilitalea sp.]|nr:nitrogenase component 1 [Mobilitalea sp.]
MKKGMVIEMINLHDISEKGACVLMREATSLSPFDYGLEYSAPVRGTWNIVHIGMLIPESHQIFVCAQSCLRGVVLTAAELGAMDRFSTITIEENNVLDGDMENLIVEGVTDILDTLTVRPKAVLIYTSCIHHFMATDLKLVYNKLADTFPEVAFVDCYMNPIMRKSKLSPDTTMRRQLYRLLKPADLRPKQVNLIGNNTMTDENSELITMLKAGGYKLLDICSCKTFDEFQTMAKSQANISFHEAAVAAGEDLKSRLGQEHLHLTASYEYKIIRENLTRVSEYFKLPLPDFNALEQETEDKIEHTAKLLSGRPIAIDYTAVDQPLGLARLLISRGFTVTAVYADSFVKQEEESFNWLKEHAGNLKLYGTLHWKMRVLPRDKGPLIAIGQKAAYYTGTDYFVNLIENDSCFGYHGIKKLMDMMEEAAITPKDTEKIIRVKGWGCCG